MLICSDSIWTSLFFDFIVQWKIANASVFSVGMRRNAHTLPSYRLCLLV